MGLMKLTLQKTHAISVSGITMAVKMPRQSALAQKSTNRDEAIYLLSINQKTIMFLFIHQAIALYLTRIALNGK